MSPMSVFLLSPPPALTLPSPFPFRHLFVAPLARRQPKPLIFPAFGSFPNHCRSITYIRSSMNVPEEELPPPTSCIPKDSLLYARGYWVTASHIAWNTDDKDESVYLFASKNANLFLTDDGVEGYDLKMQLEKDTCGLPKNVTKKFPHISSYVAYQLPKSVEVVGLIKCQVAIASFCVKGRCRKVTGLQLPGVLDDLYLYTGPLGAIFNEVASLYLWAPTAHSVCAYIFNDPLIETPVQRIQLKEYNGVWRADLPTSWEGFYYVYEVSAYHHSTLKIETCLVNDPYARGLSPDGKRTLLVNLKNEDLKPPGWDELVDEKPMLSSFNDISIYELHIRDFSVRDDTVAPSFRGGYLAFTCQDSNGMLHLKRLSEAGLSHVHLLPSYHFGGVDDLKEKWKYIDFVKLEDLPPDSDVQQAEVTAVQDEDGYNWGYNPILWGVPKGSYAYDPKGATRTLEFRKMVQALNCIGLRIVLDVVYNHVHGCGPLSDVSVLDKVVPGYYLRRNTDGFTEHSTCENNTASEHFMVERLIIDDLLCWAVDYKVDGFRFDLMGHIMKSTMVKAKNALQNLAKEKDGVDGSKIYIYGEGWDFGEVANNGRGTNATQFNVSGTGIGSFNDRMRDAVLGGSPFGHPLQQGFVTGLQLQPNEHDHGDETVTKSMLAASADQIQLGLAANLRDFVLTTHQGEVMKGSEVLLFGGTPIAYASEPTENQINYVSAHDNETLFDNICLKAPIQTSTDDRCRINNLATSLVVLSQGIPFFHAGDEILRSKSLDRDSYNSGDWFNRLDFTYESNNWGVGLPPKEKNEKNWPLMKPRLADPSFKPQKRHILSTLHNFETLLKIRYSSPLFRLKTATAIQERVRFHNTGPYWIPGIISMSIEDGLEGMPGITQLDPLFSCILVIFNARPTETSVTIPSLQNRSFRLHPLQLKSADCLVKKATYIPAVGSFTVPQRTTSVFVEVRNT